MHAAHLKSKAHPQAGKLKHVRIEMADNGGATVHAAHHGKTVHDYAEEKNVGAYGTQEEALHAAGKHMGVNCDLENEGSEASDEGGGPTTKK